MELEKWPKYYSSQLIVNNNPDARVVISTGWTKKEAIWNSLSEEARKKVLLVGQLYSKEGINYIIRNSFLNPNITTMIVCGKDLSGSIKEMKSFLLGEKKEFIHEEIPQEKINEFISYFSKNTFFIELSEVNSFLEKLDTSNILSKWTNEFCNFEEHLGKTATTFPSEKAGFRIEGKLVSETWLKVVDLILKFGAEKESQYGEKQRELIDILTVINGEDPDDPITPSYLYFFKEDLINYYPQMMTAEIFEGVEYTYGSRLRNHNNINQIEEIVEELKKENYSRRAIAFTWQVEKDCRNVKSPCLNLVQALVQDNVLYLTAYLRSNDMFRAWPQNAFGLLKIQKEIAKSLNLKIGKMVIISSSAHIYERDFLEAEKLINKNRSNLDCVVDPRGNFVIELINKEIVVRHVNEEGFFLQEFRGKNARELRDQIYHFVSDPAHAIYLGSELYRAEESLKNNDQFIQDSEV